MKTVAAADLAAGGRLLFVAPPYDLRKTLACGQAFRWRWVGDQAVGIVDGHKIRLRQSSVGIVVEGLDDPGALAGVRRYLGLDEPLVEIESRLSQDRTLRRILAHTSGIALMRQDPWECLISFVVSAFNNIPKIEVSLERLSRQFGEPAGPPASPRGAWGWGFPMPSRLAGASLRELRRCALGYRAPFVAAVAREVAGGEFPLESLVSLPYAEARKSLLSLPGVGEKVADCVLLFAYGKGEAFPVDVWVQRAVERWYFGGHKKTARQIREFARARFGPLAGYAQQHLFFFARLRGRRTFRSNG